MEVEPAFSQRLFARLTAAVVLAGVLLRLVRFALPFPLWGDEVFVCQNFLDRDFATILKPLENGQICPPLFLWLQLAAYKLFGPGEQAMRLFPLAAGVAGLLGFARLAGRMLPAFPAFLAVGFLALGIWPVAMSAFAKPYSFDLLAAVAVVSAVIPWRERPNSMFRGFLFALISTVAILGSYTAAFVAGAALLAGLPTALQCRWPGRGWYALAALGVLAAFAFVSQVGTAQLDPTASPIKKFLFEYWRHGFPPDRIEHYPIWIWNSFTGRMFAYPIGDNNSGSTLTFLSFALGSVAWWRTRPRWQFALLLVPLALNGIAAMLWKYPFGACGRLTQYAAPSICLFAGLGAATFLGLFFKTARSIRILGWTYAAIFLFLALGHLAVMIRQPYHDPEARWCRDTAAEFARKLAPGDRVVMRPPADTDVTILRWHFRLLGDRVTWGCQWPENPAAKRVFAVDFWMGEPGMAHTPPPLTPPPGWRRMETERNEHVWPLPEVQAAVLVVERFERP